MSERIGLIRRAVLAGLIGIMAVLAGPSVAQPQASRPITVFAASSLTDALQAIGQQYTAETGRPVRFSFGASSAIARQLEAGAPADLFFSADTDWMDYVAARGLIRRDTRRNLLSNRLVLIAPASSQVQLTIGPNFPLLQALGPRGRLSTGDPDSVPVGRYARSALINLGVWSDVADRLIRAENVRSALVFVSRQEAPLGIVYQTDAMIDRGVRVVGVFPTSSHLPIIYPAAVTNRGGADAQAFLDYVAGPRGQAIFRRYGFIIL